VNRIAATFGALVALTSASHADDFRCPKPGTVITYNRTSSVTLTGQVGLTCEGRSGGAVMLRMLGIIAPDFELERARAEKLLPLKVGNEIEFTTKMGSSHVIGEATDSFSMFYMRSTVTVAREEKLVTAAGTFDTFVIEHHMLSLGHVQGAWMITYWLAPEPGFMVKEKFETRAGVGPDRVLEVTSIKAP
jgi:hypothetical protein